MILVDKKNSGIERNKMINLLRQSGIGANVHYIPIHFQPYFKKMGFKKNAFVESEEYFEKAISLPIYPSLDDKKLDYIISVIKKVFKK